MGEAEGALPACPLTYGKRVYTVGGSMASGRVTVLWLTNVYTRDLTPALTVSFTCCDYSDAADWSKQRQEHHFKKDLRVAGTANSMFVQCDEGWCFLFHVTHQIWNLLWFMYDSLIVGRGATKVILISIYIVCMLTSLYFLIF